VRIVGWAAAYAVTTWLGAHTALHGSGFPLFWPASGIALAWIATSPPRLRGAELALIGLIAAAGAHGLDPSGWSALNGFVGVPLGLIAFLLVSKRWTPGLWGTGGTDELQALRQYGLLLAAAAVAGIVEVAVALLVLLPEPGTPFERVGEQGLTHTVSMGAVGVTLLIIGGWLAGLPATGRAGRFTGVHSAIRRIDLLLTVAGLAVTVLMFLLGFLWVTDAPVSFVLVMAVALVGIRYGAPLTGMYAVAVVAAASWFTAEGHGPIAAIAEPHRRALAFGVFTATLIGTGLTIALSRHERDTTIGRLRESERAAEVLADDLSLVLANLEEGVAVVEEGGRFIHANPAIGRLLHLPDFDTGHVHPVGTYHLVHTDGRPLLESEVPHARAFAGEEEVRDVLRLARRDIPGERVFEVSARVLPQLRPTDLPRAVTTIRDVTAEHEQRDALTSFAQVVAHDLRNPLTSVELWAAELLDTLDDGPVDAPTARMMLRHIESASGRMQNFISDLLAYALARDQKAIPTRLELEEVVDSVVETIAMVEGAPPRVHHADLPEVWCDPVLLPQLFDNLISNARKYVAPGVVPEVRVEGTAEDGWARVRVIDNGIGIAPEDRMRVFESFERARATEYEGTGLGLAICRHIVERHGGTIGVTTPPDAAGTCIEVTLPTSEEIFVSATGRGLD
jgi:signal transduction histidine kinase